MPSSSEILEGLGSIASEWRGLAVAWHVAWAVVVIALLAGWRPSQRLAGALLAAPLVSVSALAWAGGNPFNGTLFALLAAVLVVVGLSLPRKAVGLGRPWAVAAGVLLTAFGWVYPHFLGGGSWVRYAYAAPLGLVPCPTLSAVIGAAMAAAGLGSRPWSLTLAAAGVVYGLIGWLRLGVTIDVVLLAGALALAAATRRPRPAD